MSDDNHGLTAPRRLVIETSQEGPVCVLRLDGDLDLGSLPEAKKRIADLLDEKHTKFLLDLDKVQYIDSSGLGFLIGALKRVRESNGELKLARLNAYMMGIFKLLNLDEVLEVFDDIDRALVSFEGNQSK